MVSTLAGFLSAITEQQERCLEVTIYRTHIIYHIHIIWSRNAFSRGQPEWGAHLADELEHIITFQEASNVAAVIVEPVAGSAGVLVPPVNYLRKATRDL